MKENKKLEHFVAEHRSEFDAFDPPAGLFDKVLEGVEKQAPKPKGTLRLLWATKRIAAVLIIALAAYGLLQLTLNIQPNNNDVATLEQAPGEGNELGEAMYYYAAQVNNRRSEIEAKAQQYPEILEEIKSEFDQLDEEYKDLQKDLNENVANQMVLEAMIRNAKLKLEILEELNKEMIRIADKNSSHEKVQL